MSLQSAVNKTIGAGVAASAVSGKMQKSKPKAPTIKKQTHDQAIKEQALQRVQIKKGFFKFGLEKGYISVKGNGNS